MTQHAELRLRAIERAMDFHSRIWGPVNLQTIPTHPGPNPTPEQIIATAEKFLGFMLITKGTQPGRAKR